MVQAAGCKALPCCQGRRNGQQLIVARYSTVFGVFLLKILVNWRGAGRERERERREKGNDTCGGGSDHRAWPGVPSTSSPVLSLSLVALFPSTIELFLPLSRSSPFPLSCLLSFWSPLPFEFPGGPRPRRPSFPPSLSLSRCLFIVREFGRCFHSHAQVGERAVPSPNLISNKHACT